MATVMLHSVNNPIKCHHPLICFKNILYQFGSA